MKIPNQIKGFWALELSWAPSTAGRVGLPGGEDCTECRTG